MHVIDSNVFIASAYALHALNCTHINERTIKATS